MCAQNSPHLLRYLITSAQQGQPAESLHSSEQQGGTARCAAHRLNLCTSLIPQGNVSYSYLTTEDCNRIPSPHLHMQAKWRKGTCNTMVDCPCR